MSASNPDLNSLLGIDKGDLLTAMKKLTKIIQSEKQFDIPTQQTTQSFTSPDKMDLKIYQNTSPAVINGQSEDMELIEGFKSVTKEFSHLDVRTGADDSVLKSEQNVANHSINQTMKSQYISFEKERKVDKNLDIVDRLYQRDNMKKEKLAVLQFQKYKEETSMLRQKPEISLNSRIIAEQKHKAPIYERALVIMKQREENINRMRRQLEDTNPDLDSPTFQPDLSFTKKTNYERSRTPQEFANQAYAWQQKRNEAIQREQYENITRELSELTFKPKINNKSRNIAKKNNNEPVEVRLQKHRDQVEAKKQILMQKVQPSFKPALNERSQNMMKNRKNFGDASYRLDKSANFDTSIGEENRKRTPTKGRSVTPDGFLKTKSVYNLSQPAQISPKFNEIEYSPAVDFLLKKLE